MVMASSSQGMFMTSPASDQWWSAFLAEHGRDSEEEKAFLGYLSTHETPAGASVDVLAQAYADFLVYVDASRDAPGEPEVEPKVLEARAADLKAQRRVPRSSLSAPHLEKSMTAATRPPELREEAPPSPLTDPQLVQDATPHEPQTRQTPAQAKRPAGTAPTPPEHRGSEEGERR
jgi:hypothetical protein